MKPQDDPTIARIRETRHRISERFGHDPQKLVAYYIELQKKYQGRLLDATELEPMQAAKMPAGIMLEVQATYAINGEEIAVPTPSPDPIQNARGFLKGIDTTIEREPDRL